MDVLILAMLVVSLVSPLNSFKCSACQLVDQNWHRIQSQSTCFVNFFWVTFPQTPMFCMLIVFHTMPLVVTLSKGLVHYYYMPQASKILSTGLASIPLYKFTIRAWAISICIQKIWTNWKIWKILILQDCLFTKCQHHAGIIIPCNMLKVVPA